MSVLKGAKGASLVMLAAMSLAVLLPMQETQAAAQIEAFTLDGHELHMWTTTSAGQRGFTPISIDDASGRVTVHDYRWYAFHSWSDGATERTRDVPREGRLTAYYNLKPPSYIGELLPKTGVYVALYSYPSESNWPTWQRAIDAKLAHPSVPFVVTINPSSGPGVQKVAAFETAVERLRDAGIVVLGYTYDDYGERPLSELRADATKYAEWYGVDGLFIDEFANKPGKEQHYLDITNYARSIGMTMTMGNPGTEVPRSYVGTVDVISVTEGRGYMPISWLQHCVMCTPEKGWHHEHDKRSFAYIRHSTSWLDETFLKESARWVGLVSLTENGFFTSPSYMERIAAVLDS